MTRQAQVGIFAIVALLLLFGIFYVITDYGTRHSGYQVGIHFNSAAGLSTGALVYFSGVTVGTVESIDLLPDNTVEVILAVNKNVEIPVASKFLIQAPLTGSPNVVIVPPIPAPRPSGVFGPTPAPAAEPMLARSVLPIDQQPQGRNSATLADLLDQGQGEVRQLDSLLSDLEKREPKLLDSLQTTVDTANSTMLQLSTQSRQIADTLQTSLTQASANVVDLTGSLDKTVSGNSVHFNSIIAQLDQTSVALNKSTQSLEELATDKTLKTSLIATTKNIADTTQTVAAITHDLRTITGNPQTQAQMRNTIANLDAATQRANSLLGNFGGTSSVYGVDADATPVPTIPGASPYPQAPYPGVPYPSASPGQTSNANASAAAKRAQNHAKLRVLVKNLVSLQLRISGLSKQLACCQNPILSKDQGPQTDINAMLLSNGGTSFLIGANDIGYHSTVNFAALQRVTPTLRIGGGVLYDQLGIISEYNQHAFGLEGRLYDPRYLMLDLYGNFSIAPGARLFFGERDTLHTARRTVYGLQFQF